MMYKVDYEDLSQRVYRALKEMILTGELKSGQKLVQDELAQTLGVSRTPLLSALSKLEKEMLVESLPRRGAFVRKLSAEEFVHIYDIRLRLEPLGAGEAALAADAADVLELEKRNRAFTKLADSDQEGEIKEADYRFHMQIMQMSGNRLLHNIISSFNIILIANIEGLMKNPRQSAAEHEKIVEGVRTRNALQAEQAMYDHIYGSRQIAIERTKDHASARE